MMTPTRTSDPVRMVLSFLGGWRALGHGAFG
ncbi:unnamed protein product, partial [marine sediment metagenome]